MKLVIQLCHQLDPYQFEYKMQDLDRRRYEILRTNKKCLRQKSKMASSRTSAFFKDGFRVSLWTTMHYCVKMKLVNKLTLFIGFHDVLNCIIFLKWRQKICLYLLIKKKRIVQLINEKLGKNHYNKKTTRKRLPKHEAHGSTTATNASTSLTSSFKDITTEAGGWKGSDGGDEGMATSNAPKEPITIESTTDGSSESSSKSAEVEPRPQ
jgi:hypothetical protein